MSTQHPPSVTIQIRLNGQVWRSHEPNVTLNSLIKTLKVCPTGLIIEHNGTIYAKEIPDFHLSDGDVVEMIHFMGGGL